MEKFTLRALRANKNWNQQEAADAVGVSSGTWRNWETKKTFPDIKQVKQIESAFGVSYDDIIFLD